MPDIHYKKNKPHPPAYKKGDTKGDLTIIGVAGRFDKNPSNPDAKVRTRETWWYNVRCSCGTEEIIEQACLHRSDTRDCCTPCSLKRKGDKIAKTKRKRAWNRKPSPVEPLPTVLDYAVRNLK